MAKIRCSQCKQYVEKGNAFFLGVSSFCSAECYYKKQWSQHKPLKREKMDESLRDEVMGADGYRCRFCGGTNNLIVHHCWYLSQQGESSRQNLITLCNEPCHLSLVHGRKDRYQRLCLGVVFLREVYGDKFTTIPELERRLNG